MLLMNMLSDFHFCKNDSEVFLDDCFEIGCQFS